MQILPFTGTATNGKVVAEVRTPTFFGVALVDLRTNVVRPIENFTSRTYQALGAYDGKVAVWKEFHALDELDDFSVKEWSSTTNRVVTVGRSHRDPVTGKPYPSPWTEPTLGAGYAAWVEGTGLTGRGHLLLLNTRTIKAAVVSSVSTTAENEPLGDG